MRRKAGDTEGGRRGRKEVQIERRKLEDVGRLERGGMERAWGRRETNGRRQVKEFAGSC